METEKTARYAAMTKQIDNYTVKNFQAPMGFIIPLKRSVIIEQVSNEFLHTTASGIIIAEGGANNSSTPMVGTIIAVGPECPEYLRPGQKVVCNQYANLEIQLYGKVYIKMDDNDVYGILPDNAFVSVDNKSADEVLREKMIDRSKQYNKKKIILDANDKDKFSA